MRKFILITGIAIASAAAAPAASTSENSAAQTAPSASAKGADAAAKEKKICKLLPSSYSRRSERVCLTKAEWAKVDEEVSN